MSHRNGRGITYRQAAAGGILWAITAGVCNLLGGCGTVEGLGRDIAASSQMVREWWGKDNREQLEMQVSIEEAAR